MRKHIYIGHRGGAAFHTFAKGVLKLDFSLSYIKGDIIFFGFSLIFFECYIFLKAK